MDHIVERRVGRFRSSLFVAFVFMVSVIAASPTASLAQPSAGQGEFVPATGPLTEPLPAAPLLIAAYAFVWVAVLFYVWTLWRRLNKVEADMRILEQRQSQHR